MKKYEIKKELSTPKKVEKLDVKDMKQVKDGFVIVEDLAGG